MQHIKHFGWDRLAVTSVMPQSEGARPFNAAFPNASEPYPLQREDPPVALLLDPSTALRFSTRAVST